MPHDQFLAMMEPDVGAAIQDALGVLKQPGATLVDVRFPPLDPVVGAHRAIIFSEAAAAHEELIRTRAAELSDEVRPLLQAGLFLTATQYLAAQQARKKTIAAYRELWRSFDVLVTPTSPIAAPPIGATTARLGDKDIPLVRAFLDLTLPFNLTGQPAISVPCGFTKAGLPIGLQLVGRPFDEATLFRAAAAYESATDWHSRTPPIASGEVAASRRSMHGSAGDGGTMMGIEVTFTPSIGGPDHEHGGRDQDRLYARRPAGHARRQELRAGRRSNWWSGRWGSNPVGWRRGCYSRLDRFCEEHRVGWALTSEAGYQCFPHEPGRVRKPDVSFIRYGRLPGGVLPKGWAKIRPDLAVEVVSPNDTGR